MKAATKIIIYDDGCPLCAAYTAVFVKAGLLEDTGRKSFTDIDSATFNLVDKTKCHNEIPLVDIETKQVWYGIDALLEILDRKIPFIKWIGNLKPIKWFLQLLYNFISFNRKVIVASVSANKYDCSPDFNTGYRTAFLLFFLLFNSYMLLPFYHTVFRNSIISNSSYLQIQVAHCLLVACNITGALFLPKRKAFEYLGQINMLALICILLLLPLYMVNTVAANKDLNNFYLGMVSLFIIKEYTRRMKYAVIINNYPILVAMNISAVLAFIIYLVY